MTDQEVIKKLDLIIEMLTPKTLAAPEPAVCPQISDVSLIDLTVLDSEGLPHDPLIYQRNKTLYKEGNRRAGQWQRLKKITWGEYDLAREKWREIMETMGTVDPVDPPVDPVDPPVDPVDPPVDPVDPVPPPPPSIFAPPPQDSLPRFDGGVPRNTEEFVTLTDAFLAKHDEEFLNLRFTDCGAPGITADQITQNEVIKWISERLYEYDSQ